MRYRIVRDDFAGWEVQVKRWWWPFWYQYRFVNTFSTPESAEEWLLMVTSRGKKLPRQPKHPNSGEKE